MEENACKEDGSFFSSNSANAYKLDLPSNIGISLVFNVKNITPYHGSSNDSTPFSTTLPSSSLSTNLI